MILHPSLASADPLRYAEALTALHDAPLGSLHLDIEDTSFINNITFGMKTIQAVAQYTRHPLSLHLMVSSPQRWLPWLAAIRPGWIFIHAESVQNPRRFWRIFALSGRKQDWRLTRQRRYCLIVIWHCNWMR